MVPTSGSDCAQFRSDRGDLGSISEAEARPPRLSTLSDAVLLEICRLADNDPQLTREWLIKLRIVPLLVGSSRNAQLEPAMTWLASVLGVLTQFNPTHLPFGYAGPRMQSRGWVDRDALERVGKQIVGLMRPQMAAEVVAIVVQDAVSESVRLGFVDERRYDAWRPGMPSGSGWRSAVATTPYGVSRACRMEEVDQDCVGNGAHSVAEAARPSVVAETTEPEQSSEEQTLPQGSRGNFNGPAVQLGRPGEPCIVLSKPKKPATDAEYAIISALLRAGDEGLTKDGLEAIRPSARRILRALREDADWAEVILMPGRTNGRYRIRTSTSAHV